MGANPPFFLFPVLSSPALKCQIGPKGGTYLIKLLEGTNSLLKSLLKVDEIKMGRVKHGQLLSKTKQNETDQ